MPTAHSFPSNAGQGSGVPWAGQWPGSLQRVSGPEAQHALQARSVPGEGGERHAAPRRKETSFLVVGFF